ncbi:putative zinc finger/helix-turn-helix YgiT family protein [Paenibacillus forsythiae]|uniref:Zinc finger/helix-turn-helix YgiT family protein n=1 Tax=Paenibacillus forsythiae TaxID=365616 RepID=A0ABU3H8P5_9BACL|nr:type II TA system antitoxin MqsA family protein [Paenibacillus forsythiae]MDT3427195.1 putative zinc finger/helix-turn-helix YgiT family protein [Paenibacillus forsythiae]
MNIMNYCENCRAEHTYTIKKELQLFRFRGQDIEFERRIAFCNNCGSLIDVEELENETMANVARIYTEKHGMTSLEIQNVRKQYKLGVRPFAKLLNIGPASVTRYESGSLPQASHLELYKRLQQHPHIILEFFNRNKGSLSSRELKMVERALDAWTIAEPSFQTDEQIIESIYKTYETTDLAGYSDFSLEKFINMILYFTTNGVLKTKLMKLLWYSDFLYFKRQTVSISGATYVKYPYGPVPKHHDITLAHLQHMNVIEVDEHTNDEGWTMMIIKASEPFDSTIFNEDELETMREIETHFRDYGSRKISEYAHNEMGWLETEEKQPISYKYAEELRELH